MAPRASWKGRLTIGDLACSVALYAAATTTDRVTFHTINRKTGHRVRRRFIDSETGKPVESEDQTKGYELAEGDYITLSDDEIAAALPESDKTITVSAFVKAAEIDEIYFDKPYYLTPADKPSEEAFALIRDGLSKRGCAAVGEALLFRRLRSLLIRPEGRGMIATSLVFDYQVRSADAAFDSIGERKISAEMLDLAKHIIKTKLGQFDIAAFDDRYDAALAELVKAKIEGKAYRPAKAEAPDTVVDLMEALRQSAKSKGTSTAKAAKTTKANSKKAAEPAAKPRKRA